MQRANIEYNKKKHRARRNKEFATPKKNYTGGAFAMLYITFILEVVKIKVCGVVHSFADE